MHTTAYDDRPALSTFVALPRACAPPCNTWNAFQIQLLAARGAPKAGNLLA